MRLLARCPHRFLLLLVALCGGLTASAPLAHAQREKLSPEDLATVQKQWPGAKKTATGLRYVQLAPGFGNLIKPGDLVKVNYTGKLIDGTVFDENHDHDHPFAFRVGRDQTIAGWDEAMQLMRPYGKGIFILPYDIAYGSRGRPPKIPRRAALVFEIEVVGVEPAPPPPSEPDHSKDKEDSKKKSG